MISFKLTTKTEKLFKVANSRMASPRQGGEIVLIQQRHWGDSSNVLFVDLNAGHMDVFTLGRFPQAEHL